jgi:hypothetical protein
MSTGMPTALQIIQGIVGVLSSYPERSTATTEFAEAFEHVAFDPKHLTGGVQNGPQSIVSGNDVWQGPPCVCKNMLFSPFAC